MSHWEKEISIAQKLETRMMPEFLKETIEAKRQQNNLFKRTWCREVMWTNQGSIYSKNIVNYKTKWYFREAKSQITHYQLMQTIQDILKYVC